MRSFCRLGSFSLFLLLVLTASGCSKSKPAPPKSPFHATDITGIATPVAFSLTDPSGRKISLEQFKGKIVALFFGYTHCPDVCPTTLSDFAAAFKLLGADAANVQMLFITVDPARDTPALLKSYVPSFDARFIGLYGTDAQTRAAADAFHVFYQQQGKGADYTIDHTTGTFVFDQMGRLRLLIPYGQRPAWIAEDLRHLMNR